MINLVSQQMVAVILSKWNRRIIEANEKALSMLVLTTNKILFTPSFWKWWVALVCQQRKFRRSKNENIKQIVEFFRNM
jgi:hypothetical protein